MKAVKVHKAEDRGHADHGWLKTHHSFSFAEYHDPEKLHFGALRVLNDDVVAPGQGFGMHTHKNMEIISIPLEGDLEHRDSIGHTKIIKQGDIQIMSAGTGVSHSEFNNSQIKEVKFLQIWILPNQERVTPRYDQITLNEYDRRFKFQLIISPDRTTSPLWIHQDAWVSIGNFDKDLMSNYQLHDPRNGVYGFIIKGKAEIEFEPLSARDAIEISGVESIQIKSLERETEILLIEVPL